MAVTFNNIFLENRDVDLIVSRRNLNVKGFFTEIHSCQKNNSFLYTVEFMSNLKIVNMLIIY